MRSPFTGTSPAGAGHQAAEDLLGEVWLRAFGARRGYDTSYDDARPWLYGIARNVLRAHWRTSQNIGLATAEATLDPWDEITDRARLGRQGADAGLSGAETPLQPSATCFCWWHGNS